MLMFTYLTPVDLGIRVCGNFSVDRLQVMVSDIATKQRAYGLAELIKSQVFWNTYRSEYMVIFKLQLWLCSSPEPFKHQINETSQTLAYICLKF